MVALNCITCFSIHVFSPLLEILKQHKTFSSTGQHDVSYFTYALHVFMKDF